MKTKNLFFILMMILLGRAGSAQQIPVHSIFDGQKISYDAYTQFTTYMTENCKGLAGQPYSAISIQPSLKRGSVKQIEGIETKKAGKTTLTVRIKDKITGRDSLLRKDFDVAAVSEYEMDRIIMTKIGDDSKFWNQLCNAVSSVYGQADCKKIQESIKATEAKEGVSQAMQQLSRAENTYNHCRETWASYASELKNKINGQICDQSLYEAKIMINSGKEQLINRAVGLLLQIPPDAKCREDALRLSEELYKRTETNQKNKDKLSKYRSLVTGNGYNQWLELITE